MTKYLNAKNGIEILHKDGQTQLLAGSHDPTIEGQEAEIGSIFLRSDGGGVYSKTGPGLLDWSIVVEAEDNTFIQQPDSPATYSGSEGHFLVVDTSASGIRFSDVIDGGSFL